MKCDGKSVQPNKGRLRSESQKRSVKFQLALTGFESQRDTAVTHYFAPSLTKNVSSLDFKIVLLKVEQTRE